LELVAGMSKIIHAAFHVISLRQSICSPIVVTLQCGKIITGVNGKKGETR
jgi:hypothetical protein